MEPVETPTPATQPSSIAKPFSWLIRGAWFLIRTILIVWASLAIFYNVPGTGVNLVAAAGFAAFSIWALWFSTQPRGRWLFVVLFLAVLGWFAAIRPLQVRNWRREVAVLPRAQIEGDRVRLTNVRDFDFRSRNDFTVRYVEREVDVAHLQSVDLFLSYWQVGPVGHTFVSFNFDNAPPVCISIETRPEVGEGFAPIASMFKQFELIYVVGEERDLVAMRILHRNEKTLLYRLKTPPQAARLLFRVYLDRINELADRAEWYHLLKNSCTINIVRYANVAGRVGEWHIGHLLNGWVDRYLYESGVVDTSLPFEELRERSWINDAVQSADLTPEFSHQIRENLPGITAENPALPAETPAGAAPAP